MGKFVMVVQSMPKLGRDAEYNAWYDSTHFHDICDLPGVTGGRRLEAVPLGMGAPGLPYLALFEIEAESPASVLQEMGRRSQSGEWQMCDALDAPASIMWFYEQRTPTA